MRFINVNLKCLYYFMLFLKVNISMVSEICIDGHPLPPFRPVPRNTYLTADEAALCVNGNKSKHQAT
jgi:hypothetical protein